MQQIRGAAPVAFNLAFEKSSIFKPWTISHLPPLHLTGNEKMMSCREHDYCTMFSAQCNSICGPTNMQLKCICMQLYACLSLGFQQMLGKGAEEKRQMQNQSEARVQICNTNCRFTATSSACRFFCISNSAMHTRSAVGHTTHQQPQQQQHRCLTQ